jgi:hypothetical protein
MVRESEKERREGLEIALNLAMPNPNYISLISPSYYPVLCKDTQNRRGDNNLVVVISSLTYSISNYSCSCIGKVGINVCRLKKSFMCQIGLFLNRNSFILNYLLIFRILNIKRGRNTAPLPHLSYTFERRFIYNGRIV